MRKQRIPGSCTPTCDSNVHELRSRVRLHVTEMKAHPRMKKFLFTSEFHPVMKRVEFHPPMKFNLKENLPLSMET